MPSGKIMEHKKRNELEDLMKELDTFLSMKFVDAIRSKVWNAMEEQKANAEEEAKLDPRTKQLMTMLAEYETTNMKPQFQPLLLKNITAFIKNNFS